MISTEDFKKYLEETIKNYIEKDITMNVSNEFAYNTDNDLDITLKVLTGQLQGTSIRLPFNLIIFSEESKTREIIDDLKQFAVDMNNTKIVIGEDEITQFYSTPMILQNFINMGLKNYNQLYMEGTLILINDGINSKDVSVKISFEDQSYTLQGFLSASYSSKKVANGVVLGFGMPTQKNYVTSIMDALALNVDLKKSDPLFLELSGNKDKIRNYKITYSNGIVETQNTMILSDWTESIIFGDIARTTISFVSGD